jgi:hypothetical protein
MSPNTTVQGIVTLPNLVTLKALYIDEAQGPIPITGFLFPQLTTITDSLELFSEHITTLEFPLLSEVGDIIFLSLPALRSWSGTDSLQSVGKLLLNRDNISSLSFGNLSTALGLSFFFSSPYGSLYLNGTASPAVLVAGSNDTTLVNDLRDTTTTAIVGCNNITINSVSASSLEIFMNPDLEQLYMPNLVSLGPYNSTAATYIDSALEPPGAGLSDTLLIADNPKIQEFSFPNLTTIQGTLEILNNDLLFAIEGFPLLRNVSGNISLIGNLEP